MCATCRHIQQWDCTGAMGAHVRTHTCQGPGGTARPPPREDHACVRCGCDNLPAPTHLPGRLAPRGGHFPKAAVVRIGTHTHTYTRAPQPATCSRTLPLSTYHRKCGCTHTPQSDPLQETRHGNVTGQLHCAATSGARAHTMQLSKELTPSYTHPADKPSTNTRQDTHTEINIQQIT